MREGTTSSSGLLVIPLLTAGTYTLQAVRDGFKTEIVRDIAVQAGVRGTVAVVLVPGAVSEQVIVSADLSTLRAGSGTVGTVFEGETLVTVPVSERDVIQFTFQAPGVAPPSPGSRLSTQGNTGLNNSGSREAANNFLLDGVDNNDLFLNRLVVNPSLDAVKEVSLLQSTYDAEHGRSAGAQVNVVIKSGTRTLRGSAYEYFRDEAFDARPRVPARRRRHALAAASTSSAAPSAGRSVGCRRSTSSTSRRSRPTRPIRDSRACRPLPSARATSARWAGRCIDPFTQRPFPGNVIPASRMSAAGLNTAALYPLPNTSSSGAANYVSSPEGQRDAIQFTVKTDHHGWRDKPFHVRYTFGREDRELPFPARARNLPTFGTSVLDQGHNFAAGFNQAISSRVVNEFRVGVECPHARQPADQRGDRRLRGARHHGPVAARGGPGVPDVRRQRVRDARRRREPAGPAQHAHHPSRRHPHGADRAASRQDRRRVPALPVGRPQPSLRPRADHLRRGPHRRAVRRPAARAADAVAPRHQRQPAATAHVVDQHVRPGRLAAVVAAHREHGPALRVQRAAGGRRRPHADLRPGHQPDRAGRHQRRAAVGHRLRLQQRRAAHRLQLRPDRHGHDDAAGRLRDVLQHRHAHRDLGVVLQPAVLRHRAVLSVGPAPAHAREPVPGAGHRHAADLQLARPEHAHGLRASGQPRRRALVREDDGRCALRRVVRPATRAQAQHQPGPARSRRRSRRAAHSRSTATS